MNDSGKTCGEIAKPYPRTTLPRHTSAVIIRAPTVIIRESG
jgi:hypothetical protein